MITCTEAQDKAQRSTAVNAELAISLIDEALADWAAAGNRGYAPMPATCTDGSPLIVRNNFACQDTYLMLIEAKVALGKVLKHLS